jgi:DNA-binding HxlR family transcriptional regulator
MQEDCSVYRVADIVGKRWTILILLELYKGRQRWKRYSHIKSRLPGITPKMLSERLKELERDGMLDKRVDARMFPVKSEYRLTPSGSDFIGIIGGIKAWSLKWKSKNRKCRETGCRDCEL